MSLAQIIFTANFAKFALDVFDIDISYHPLNRMFAHVHYVLHRTGVGKVRAQVLEKRLQEHGAHLEEKPSERTTHIFAAVPYESLPEELCDAASERAVFYSVEWIAESIRVGKAQPKDSFILAGWTPQVRSFRLQHRAPPVVVVPPPARKLKRSRSIDNHIDAPPPTPAAATAITLHYTPSPDADDDVTRPKKHALPSSSSSSLSLGTKAMLLSYHTPPPRVAPTALGVSFDDSSGKEEKELAVVDQPSALHLSPELIRKRATFACQQPSSKHSKLVNYNEELTKILGQLANSAHSTGEKWRAYSYRKAASAISKYPRVIRSGEEALQLPGIGESIAEKIDEILATGRLRKIDYRDEFTRACETFTNVWGAGPEAIKTWYSMGFRTLEDLRQAPPTALTTKQRVGLKYYEDFQLRIPRAEVTEIVTLVNIAAKAIAPNARVLACGSYRRGQPTCGDVDILITTGIAYRGFLPALVRQLHASRLLTDDLNNSGRVEQDIYYGVCRLRAQLPHRRLDIRMIGSAEWPFASLYFTGSDHFNRSIRLWAKKNGMHLSERGLWKQQSPDQEVFKPADALPGITTEEEIFSTLGLEYIAPEDRNV